MISNLREIDYQSLLVGITSRYGLMYLAVAQTYKKRLTADCLIRKPNCIPTDKFLVKRIISMGCYNKLRLRISAVKEPSDKLTL